MGKAMEQLRVELGERSYDILIGSGLLTGGDSIERFLPELKGKQAMLVSNDTVAPLYMKQLQNALPSFEQAQAVLPDGENFKNLTELNTVYTELLTARHSRTTTLFALGGGVVGDMAGYAAASYQRGVDFVQIPTTLLSQVDSSVGGKTGVNHAMGKNMIGAFHQPRLVVIDIDTLKTLPDRELAAGIAEVIKYGLIYDAEFLVWLEQHIDDLNQRDPDALIYAIKRSCEIKAAIVAEDEREGGIRAILNLGHTFGHAIETAMGYGEWLHGEAVAAGMVMAVELSQCMGWVDADLLERTRRLLAQAHLPILPPSVMTTQQFMDLMAVDKKNIDKQLRLVLLKAPGQAIVTSEVPLETLQRYLDAVLQQAGAA